MGRSTLGIPYSARASRKLFTTKILLAGGTTAYVAISQKVLKGAAARMFIYWLCIALVKIDDGSLRSQFLSIEMQNVREIFWYCLNCFCGMLMVLFHFRQLKIVYTTFFAKCLNFARHRLSICLALTAMYSTFAEHGKLGACSCPQAFGLRPFSYDLLACMPYDCNAMEKNGLHNLRACQGNFGL